MAVDQTPEGRQHAVGHAGHNTKGSTWVCVVIMILAVLAGGIALIEWNWVVFWIAVGVAVASTVAAGVTGIMDQIEEYGGPAFTGDPHSTLPESST